MEKRKKQLTGILLAGGASRRMGSDKSLIDFKGIPLIQHCYTKIKDICDEIIISANIPDKYSFLNAKTIPDEVIGLGPIGGIYACLKHSGSDANLILASDMPYLSVELINYLCDHKGLAEFVVPETTPGKIEPLCAIYHKAVIPLLKKMIDKNELKIQNLRFYCSTIMVNISPDLDFYTPTLFQNINTPDDLNKLKENND